VRVDHFYQHYEVNTTFHVLTIQRQNLQTRKPIKSKYLCQFIY